MPGAAPASGSRVGPELAVATCAEQLALFRAQGGGGPEPALEWEVPWHLDGEAPATEATIQAECGLMHVHGLRWGGPRALGLERTRGPVRGPG